MVVVIHLSVVKILDLMDGRVNVGGYIYVVLLS